MGDLSGIPVSSLTPAGLLALIILLIAFGRLVPRKTLEDVIKDRDEWREAHRISEAARGEVSKNMEKLLEHAETTDALVRAALPNYWDRPPPAPPTEPPPSTP